MAAGAPCAMLCPPALARGATCAGCCAAPTRACAWRSVCRLLRCAAPTSACARRGVGFFWGHCRGHAQVMGEPGAIIRQRSGRHAEPTHGYATSSSWSWPQRQRPRDREALHRRQMSTAHGAQLGRFPGYGRACRRRDVCGRACQQQNAQQLISRSAVRCMADQGRA